MYYLYNDEQKAIINNNKIKNNLNNVKWADIEYFDAINKWGFKKPDPLIPCIYPYSQIINGVEFDEELEYSNDWCLPID